MKRFNVGLVVVVPVGGRGVAFGWVPKVQAGQRCPAVIIGPRPHVRVALARMGLWLMSEQA